MTEICVKKGSFRAGAARKPAAITLKIQNEEINLERKKNNRIFASQKLCEGSRRNKINYGAQN